MDSEIGKGIQWAKLGHAVTFNSERKAVSSVQCPLALELAHPCPVHPGQPGWPPAELFSTSTWEGL